MKPHKHAEVIKAWADGAKIQYRNNDMKDWADMPECSPLWYETVEYRTKPEDLVITYIANPMHLSARSPEHWETPNLKLTFDIFTRRLKAAEVIS
jgi:hypothetical protein